MADSSPLMKLFIVDDSESLRERLAQAVAEIRGITLVGQAGDAVAAIEGIRRRSPQVVLLDIRLPGGSSGIEVLDTIKRELPATKVLMFTAHSTPQYRERCLSAGADHFFDKHTDFAKLVEALASLARQPEQQSLDLATGSATS